MWQNGEVRRRHIPESRREESHIGDNLRRRVDCGEIAWKINGSIDFSFNCLHGHLLHGIKSHFKAMVGFTKGDFADGVLVTGGGKDSDNGLWKKRAYTQLTIVARYKRVSPPSAFPLENDVIIQHPRRNPLLNRNIHLLLASPT